MRIIRLIILFFLSFIFSYAFSQDRLELGSPLIEHYASKDYNSHPQNWSVVENESGAIFFANSSGILIYDGENWVQLKTELSTVRSLAISEDNTIYATGANGFGKLVKDSIGRYKYQSLTEGLETEEIRRVILKNGKAFFHSNLKFYEYSKGKIKIHPAQTGFTNIFNVHNKIFVQQHSKGLYEYRNNSLNNLNISEIFKEVGIRFMLPYNETDILVGTRYQGLFLIKKEISLTPDSIKKNITVEKFKTNADEYIIENHLYHGIKLKSGNYALATDFGGVLIINKKGKLIKLLNKQTGLENETINYIFEDSQLNLWIAFNNGIACLNNKASINVFSDRLGVKDIVTNIRRHKGILYIGTMQGLRYLKIDNELKNKKNPIFKFNKIGDKLEACLYMDTIDGELYTAMKSGLYKVGKAGLKEVFKTYNAARSFIQLQSDPNILLLSTNAHFIKIKKENDKYIAVDTLKKFSGIVRRFFNDKKGNIWFNIDNIGLFVIKETSFINDNAEDNYILLDKNSGLKNLSAVSFQIIDDKLIVTSSNDVFEYDYKKQNLNLADFLPYEYNNKRIDYSLIGVDREGYLWANPNFSTLARFKKDSTGKYFIKDTYHANISQRTIFCNYMDVEKDYVWIGGAEGLYSHPISSLEQKRKPVNTIIRKLLIGKDSLLFQGFYTGEQNKNVPVIDSKYNTIKFQYSAPFYGIKGVEYSYFLNGFDESWSKWLAETKAKYTNLPAGTYIFNVKAKTKGGFESQIAKYKLEVLHPWHKTVWAIIAYIVLGILVIYLIIYFYTARLKKANLKLENIVLERTKEIQEKNTKLEKLSIVASKTDNAIMIMDEKGNFEWSNDAMVRLYGYSHIEIVSQGKKNIIEFSKYKKIKEVLNKCLTEKKSVVYQSVITTKSGEEIWAQTTITPILNNKGKIIKTVAIDTDITKNKEAELKIKKQNKLISQSINYAKKIQTAILPSENTLETSYKESFVLFKPKDVVSGDFYWHFEDKERIYTVVADCTGHGVPGAFMSMIGTSELNEIIKTKKVRKPGNILEKLNKEIITTLNQDTESSESTDDGMDISISVYHKKDKILKIAGSNHIVVLANSNGIKQIEGDIYSIGGIFSKGTNIAYSTHNVDIDEETSVYLFTDGYQDQFNEEYNKKFMQKNVIDLIKKNYDKTMKEQYDIFNNALIKWQGKGKQIDDILFIGYKL